MFAVTVREYRSTMRAGSKPVSAIGNAMRSVFAGAAAVAAGPAASAGAPATASAASPPSGLAEAAARQIRHSEPRSSASRASTARSIATYFQNSRTKMLGR